MMILQLRVAVCVGEGATFSDRAETNREREKVYPSVLCCFQVCEIKPSDSLFYVNDIGSTGSWGRTRGIPYVTKFTL